MVGTLTPGLLAPPILGRGITGTCQNPSWMLTSELSVISLFTKEECVISRSVMSDSLQPSGLQPAGLLWPGAFSRQEYWSGSPCPPPGGSSRPRDRAQVTHIAGRFLTIWATRETHRRGDLASKKPWKTWNLNLGFSHSSVWTFIFFFNIIKTLRIQVNLLWEELFFYSWQIKYQWG